MMKYWLKGLALVAVLTWCVPASAECLSRSVTDSRGQTHRLQAVVPSDEVRDYHAKGFEVATCAIQDVAAFRKNMCELAKRGNQAVQNHLEQVLGIKPAQMCASASLMARSKISDAQPQASASLGDAEAPGQ